MQGATFVGGHGREGEWAAGSADFLDSDFCHHIELSIAGSFEVLRVKVDQIVIFGFEAEDFCGDVLDGVEKFAVAGDQKRRIRSREVDCDLWGFCRRGWLGRGLGCTGGIGGAGGHLTIAGKDVGG